ncbi:PREDICTED: protein FAM156A/FAM156B-like [Dipodomys ordii]|uniref:Protein FAM156A/FAM156B-like n=1 Tax=Dipodomys ordii TaxID=10020 RepID=A0A1S3GR78_DIPOR|nr:PREDICTED: protein FAM156A/FAM156B-like [Dipodomys ordii]
MEEDNPWEISTSTEKKAKFLKHRRSRYAKASGPFWRGRKVKSSSSHDVEQKRFKCECYYCKKYPGTSSGISVNRKSTSYSSPWYNLSLSFSNLTLNPGTNQPPLVQEWIQESEMMEEAWKQQSKRAFQRLVHIMGRMSLSSSSSGEGSAEQIMS